MRGSESKKVCLISKLKQAQNRENTRNTWNTKHMEHQTSTVKAQEKHKGYIDTNEFNKITM